MWFLKLLIQQTRVILYTTQTSYKVDMARFISTQLDFYFYFNKKGLI
jgi:hypothetical protein